MYTAQQKCVYYRSRYLIAFVLEITWQHRGIVTNISRVNCIPPGTISVIVTTWSRKPLNRFYGGNNDGRFTPRWKGHEVWIFSYRKTLLNLHRLCHMFHTMMTMNSVIFRDNTVQTDKSLWTVQRNLLWGNRFQSLSSASLHGAHPARQKSYRICTVEQYDNLLSTTVRLC